MSEKIHSSKKTVEAIRTNEAIEMRYRKQVELRLRFCEAVVAKTGMPLVSAFEKYSDLLRRIEGISEIPDPEFEAAWRSKLGSVAELRTHEERLNRLVQLYVENESNRLESADNSFYPFSYDYDEPSRTICPHFGTLNVKESGVAGPGYLSSERFEEMRGKLRNMFTEIKRSYPDAEKVRGSSWLHGIDAYRRLYPKAYEDTAVLRTDKFTGGGSWGQFLDTTGDLHTERAEQFLKNLDNLDPEKLYAAFPIPTYTVQCPISEFYREYGIE